jgi:competence ComEA-like helix-hairpin-helix protein
MEPVELVVDGEPRLACTTELSSCGASAGDRVTLDGDLCRIDRGAMSGAMRMVAGLPIDLNRATAGDLELLDGIGPKLAAAVVAYREANGPFLTADDLVLVRGIGPVSLAKLKPYVTVSFDR